jgi:argonaute-like protein implicated in RNA metabolism and viral defense
MENENKLHNWEEENKDLCWVNLQKNLAVMNLKTEKEDIMHSGTRLYEADSVNKIIHDILEIIWKAAPWKTREERVELIYDRLVEKMNECENSK